MINCLAISQGQGLAIKTTALDKWIAQWQSQINVRAISVTIYDTRHKLSINRTILHSTKSPPVFSHNIQFCFGSLVKTFVVAIILKMEEQGLLSTNWSIHTFAKKVNKFSYYNIVKHFGDVSILNLMNMTSGIYSYTEDRNYRKELNTDDLNTQFKTDERLIHIALEKPEYFISGKGWHYSDTSYLILGKLIQSIACQQPAITIETLLIHALTQHLGNTTLLREKAANLTPGFNSKNKEYVSDIALGRLAREIYSTTEDMTKWFALLLTGEVLTDKSMKKMMTLYSKNTGRRIKDNETGYSLALDHTRSECGSLWFYPGNSRGFTTFALWLPEQGLSASVALNKETDFMAIFKSFLNFIGCPIKEAQ